MLHRCGETSSKNQDHLALFLDVPPTSEVRPSLQEALSRYMEPDIRERRCSRCSGQRTRVQTVFTKLPRCILSFVVVLKVLVSRGDRIELLELVKRIC